MFYGYSNIVGEPRSLHRYNKPVNPANADAWYRQGLMYLFNSDNHNENGKRYHALTDKWNAELAAAAASFSDTGIW